MGHLTQTQKEWLDTATPEEIELFLAKGPASRIMMLDIESMIARYVPMIRGMICGDTYGDSKQATQSAENALRKLQCKVKGKTPLDENSLGIDGKNAQCLEQCEAHEIRVNDIIHLASVIATDAMEYSFFEPIDEFVEFLGSEVAHHKSIRRLIPKDLNSSNHINCIKEDLHDYWLRNGFFGFAILVTTPVGDKSDNSSGWGRCMSEWFYAEKYEWAFDMAVEWVKEQDESND